MKKSVFLLFGILFLAFLQLFSSHTIRILTFHSKIEREIINQVSKTCWILDGNFDLNVGSSPYAIYKVTLAGDENYYVVLAREKQTGRDLILMIHPKDFLEINRVDIFPYQFQRNNNMDFRGLIDMNEDRNLELICVVNGKVGKRIKVFKFLQKNLQEIPISMIENYVNISVNDFNLDGIPDIACYGIENGIMLPPQFYKMTGNNLVLEDFRLFPTVIMRYKKYINTVEKKTRTESNPAIGYDLMIAKARISLSENDEESFNAIKTFFNSSSESMDILKKIRLYRIIILESYFFFQKGEEKEAFQKIYEAIDNMYGETMGKTQRESLFYTELAIFDLYRNNWISANKQIQSALILDPSNTRARQCLIWMGSE